MLSKEKILGFICSACLLLNAQQNEAIYHTSFENFGKDNAEVNEFIDGEAIWQSKNTAVITSISKKTGHFGLTFSGKEKKIEIVLDGGARNAKGLEFFAERWTQQNPFALTLFLKSDGKWQEVANLSKVIELGGSAWKTPIIIKFAEEIKQITAVKFLINSPEGKGIIIDDFKLLKGVPEKATIIPEIATEKIANIYDANSLFVSGTEGAHTYRIPAIITAKNGDIIAACDARIKNSADLIHVREIDIVLKRSMDNGKTWTNMEKIGAFGDGKPASDPSFILDEKTGEIFCFYNFMDKDKTGKEFRLWYQSSTDNGKTWSKPRDITNDISKKEWRRLDFKFITSGRGIYTKNGKILHTLVHLTHGVFVFGSDDHGKTWKLFSEAVKPADESKIIELEDQTLMINSRVNNGSGFRWVHRSKDEGKTWASEVERQLVDPACNGSILRYTSIKDGSDKNRLLFSNANSSSGRNNLALKISYDEGKTWSKGKVIDPGASAYSDLTILKDGSIGIFYEPGYGAVRFVRVTLEDLTDGKDSLKK